MIADYSPQLTRVKMGRDPPKSRMWILYAFCGVACLGIFNWVIGAYNSDPIGGKIINSLVMGIGALLIHIYQKAYLNEETNLAAEKTYYETMKRGRRTAVTELLEKRYNETMSRESQKSE